MTRRRLYAVAAIPLFFVAYALRPSRPSPDPSMPNRVHYYYIATESGFRPFDPSEIPPWAWLPTAGLGALGVAALAIGLCRRR